MLCYSTADPRHRTGLVEAISRGLPPVGGYYMPERLPLIPRAFFNNMADMSLKDIGYVVANTLFGEEIPAADLKAIVADAINFDTPLRSDDAAPGLYTLELFHGPSHSYKDFGARFMAHILRRVHHPDKMLDIVVATTGDAGEAVARSFFGMSATRVFILYPRVGTGVRQLASFASLGGNIIPVEVRGNFAECHDMARAMFADPSVTKRRNLFAANSFNLARLLPQTIYYFYAYAQLLRAGADTSRLDIAVPSGNLGNLTAGLFAKRMGLPTRRIIAARPGTPDAFHALVNHRQVPRDTAGNGTPPNFWRIMALYGNDIDAMRAETGSVVIDPARLPDASLSEPVIAAARQALVDSSDDATARLYLATTETGRPGQPLLGHTPLRPAAVLPPSPAIFRDFILSH